MLTEYDDQCFYIANCMEPAMTEVFTENRSSWITDRSSLNQSHPVVPFISISFEVNRKYIFFSIRVSLLAIQLPANPKFRDSFPVRIELATKCVYFSFFPLTTHFNNKNKINFLSLFLRITTHHTLVEQSNNSNQFIFFRLNWKCGEKQTGSKKQRGIKMTNDFLLQPLFFRCTPLYRVGEWGTLHLSGILRNAD